MPCSVVVEDAPAQYISTNEAMKSLTQEKIRVNDLDCFKYERGIVWPRWWNNNSKIVRCRVVVAASRRGCQHVLLSSWVKLQCACDGRVHTRTTGTCIQ